MKMMICLLIFLLKSWLTHSLKNASATSSLEPSMMSDLISMAMPVMLMYIFLQETFLTALLMTIKLCWEVVTELKELSLSSLMKEKTSMDIALVHTTFASMPILLSVLELKLSREITMLLMIIMTVKSLLKLSIEAHQLMVDTKILNLMTRLDQSTSILIFKEKKMLLTSKFGIRPAKALSETARWTNLRSSEKDNLLKESLLSMMATEFLEIFFIILLTVSMTTEYRSIASMLSLFKTSTLSLITLFK